MNESTLVQLKIIVERAVRPVRANTLGKRKMREELLAHVTAILEDELAKAGDENAALARTRERFGNPAELTRQLQRALSWRDRLSWLAEFLILPPDIPHWRRALRHANSLLGGLLALMAFFMLLGLTLRWLDAVESRPTQAGKGWLETGILLGFVWAVTFLCSVIAQKASAAVHGPAERFWPRILFLSVLASFASPGVCLGFALLATWDLCTTWSEMLWLLPAMVIVPPFLLVFLAKTLRQIFHGPDTNPWLHTILVDLGCCLVPFGLIWGLTLLMPGVAKFDLVSAVAVLFWLGAMPIMLGELAALRSAKFRSDFERQFSVMRENEEWANLPIDGKNGALA